MNRSAERHSHRVLPVSRAAWLKAAAVGVMVWGVTAASGCAAEVVAEPAYYPPPTFVAGTTPVYFEGRPAWYYNDRWYFRSGGGWGYYRSEPAYLRQQRAYGPPANAWVRGGAGHVVVRGR
jgi:hypothetical protein